MPLLWVRKKERWGHRYKVLRSKRSKRKNSFILGLVKYLVLFTGHVLCCWWESRSPPGSVGPPLSSVAHVWTAAQHCSDWSGSASSTRPSRGTHKSASARSWNGSPGTTPTHQHWTHIGWSTELKSRLGSDLTKWPESSNVRVLPLSHILDPRIENGHSCWWGWAEQRHHTDLLPSHLFDLVAYRPAEKRKLTELETFKVTRVRKISACHI